MLSYTGELGYDGLNGTRKIGPSYAKSVVYIWRILNMHRTGTKHIVRHMLKSVVQWSVISKFTCNLKLSNYAFTWTRCILVKSYTFFQTAQRVRWRPQTFSRRMSPLPRLLMTPLHVSYPLSCWWLIWWVQNDAKNMENDRNPGKWVLIWEYSMRAIQWIPTWQGLSVFQKSLRFCALDESSHSIERVIISTEFISIDIIMMMMPLHVSYYKYRVY